MVWPNAYPQPTVYRILNTLKIRGYVDRKSDGTYRISSKLFNRRHQKSREEMLLELAKPAMVSLSLKCQETVNLAILDGHEMVIIGTVEGPQSLRLITKVGNRRYIHSTALGKAYAAHMDEAELRCLLKASGLPRLTARSITNQTAFFAELKRVRRSKFAVDDQENELGVCCVACTVEGSSGGPVAALSISGPAFRLTPQRLRYFRAALREGSAQISAGFQSRRLA
jgi:IclR family transcriptional regulator, acetate operon repressor